jgi:hypothetical protein
MAFYVNASSEEQSEKKCEQEQLGLFFHRIPPLFTSITYFAVSPLKELLTYAKTIRCELHYILFFLLLMITQAVGHIHLNFEMSFGNL